MPLFRLVRCWLALALFFMAFTGCTPKYVRLTKQGDALLARQDVEGAQRRYEKALKRAPKYAPALVKLGTISLEAGKWEKAQQWFTATIEADPQVVEAYRGRGIARLQTRQLEAAGEDLRKAKELGSTRADLPLGIYQYLTRDYEAAFRSLAAASQNDSDTEQAGRYLFKTAFATRDYKTGRELLAKAHEPPAPPPEARDDEEDEDEMANKRPERNVAANTWRRMQLELAYLDMDFSAASRLLSQVDDGLSLGIWYRDAAESTRSRLGSAKGVAVEYVELGSPAAVAGIQPTDIITSFERSPTRNAEELSRAIRAYEERVTHDQVLVEVLRGNEQLAFRLIPGNFQTRELIGQAGEGVELIKLSMAPDDMLKLP